jgi:LmbE family N-acetylglucosaminyl deacetylase
MYELLANKRILCVVAHPDDEILGLGATIHNLIHHHGCIVRAVILGEGITSRSDERDREKWAEELAIHRANIQNAAKTIGYESTGIYDFPDNRFDSVALLDIVKIVEKEKQEFQPSVIFTHHGGDTNIDHRCTFDAVITATRPMLGEVVRSIFTFETPSSTEWQAFNYPNYFMPNVFMHVSKINVEAKIAAMEHYEFERRLFPHPRSPEALEILARKHAITIGAEYAEAFMLIRCIS